MPMAKHTSPRQMRGRMSILTCSGAYLRRIGPLWRSATKCRRTGAFATRNSSVTTCRSRKLRSCPPYFFGQVMPIQPLAPTLRLNSRENDPLPSFGEKVPASISWRRKARTSWRNSLASGGSSIGSKLKLKVIDTSRALGNEGPELVGAVRRDHPAETLSPHRLVAEFLAPRPEAPRRMMQRMLVGEAHRTVHLVGDSRPGAGCLAAAHLGDRHLGDGDLRARAGLRGGVRCRTRGGHLARQYRQIVLDRLELGDRAPELRAVERMLHRLLENLFEGTGHLLQPHGRAKSHQPVLVESDGLHHLGHHSVERHIVLRLARQARRLANRQARCRD